MQTFFIIYSNWFWFKVNAILPDIGYHQHFPFTFKRFGRAVSNVVREASN